jgi:DNA-binding transcriptional regulator YiaG
MEVDPSTLARWERGERKPSGKLLDRMKRFLESQKAKKPERDVA